MHRGPSATLAAPRARPGAVEEALVTRLGQGTRGSSVEGLPSDVPALLQRWTARGRRQRIDNGAAGGLE